MSWEVTVWYRLVIGLRLMPPGEPGRVLMPPGELGGYGMVPSGDRAVFNAPW